MTIYPAPLTQVATPTTTSSQKLAIALGTYGHGDGDHRCIEISHGDIKSACTITFERTLRVPDNKAVNNLPPSLGQFPLFSVKKYGHKMPEEMRKKGGLFLPMYQREGI